MFHYRSASDLHASLLRTAYCLPTNLDLVIGVPGSGLLAANFLALMANLPLTDLDSYLDGRTYTSGISAKAAGMLALRQGPRKVLVLDGSINTGKTMVHARARISAANLGDEVIYAAVYGIRDHHEEVDIVFETVPLPRMFQWDFMHHVFLEQSCVDIDGVLCDAPSREEDDDGEAYLRFLLEARPLYRPTRTIGALVTSRLEKYRPQTEAWLEREGVRYGRLVMLDLPNAEEHRRLGDYASFKAEHYRKSDAILFIKREIVQSQLIAQLSGKPVLCLETHRLITPS